MYINFQFGCLLWLPDVRLDTELVVESVRKRKVKPGRPNKGFPQI